MKLNITGKQTKATLKEMYSTYKIYELMQKLNYIIFHILYLFKFMFNFIFDQVEYRDMKLSCIQFIAIHIYLLLVGDSYQYQCLGMGL
ncbi:hypothetical protein pb186bvf_003255 [Paramecium bursaria]